MADRVNFKLPPKHNIRPDDDDDYKHDELFKVMFEQELIDQPQIRYIVEDFLPEDTTIVGWGESQACKSFVFLDVALSLTHGVRWHGLKTHSCAVAYIAAEGARGIGKRVRGWKQQHKIDHATSPFALIPSAVNILKVDDVKKLIWQLKKLQKEHNVKLGLVVIDTLAKCMVGGDENAAKDMGLAVSHTDLIREELGGISVVSVHHCGKDLTKGPRGSYSLFAGVNTSIFIERHKSDGEDFITVALDKQKDDESDLDIKLNVVKVQLPLREGDNAFKPESTLILENYRMECNKAFSHPTEGCSVDPKFADLVSIGSWMANDSVNAVSAVATAVFGHTRHSERVRDAVPKDWIEVKTQLGTRLLRQIGKPNKTGDGTRFFIECRHLRV
jgi:hypothetical protein